MKIDASVVLASVGVALIGYGLYRAVVGNATPPVVYGEPKVTTPFPDRYRRLTQAEVTPVLAKQAIAIRNTPGFTSMQYGTVIPIGGPTAALVEQHYHEPGGPMKPWGYHHGVTLIAQA